MKKINKKEYINIKFIFSNINKIYYLQTKTKTTKPSKNIYINNIYLFYP